MSVIQKINPKQLFLIDSLGGLLSAFMLGIVLVQLETWIGMPAEVLQQLASMACLYFVYSLVCFLLVKKNWQFYMRFIAVANLLYCCLTMVLVMQLHSELTILGIIYFVVEVFIIASLAVVELNVAARQQEEI